MTGLVKSTQGTNTHTHTQHKEWEGWEGDDGRDLVVVNVDHIKEL